MSDQAWDVLEFIERFRTGDFEGRLEEALESLTPEQRKDLLRALRSMPEDLKRTR